MSRAFSSPIRRQAVSKTLSCLAVAGGFLYGSSSVLTAGESSTLASLAEREAGRRAAQVQAAQPDLDEAARLLKDGQAEAAYLKYESVYMALPDVPLTQETRTLAREGYVRAGLTYAGELMASGNYPAAIVILEKLDGPAVAPGDRRIARLRAKLEDPDRFPPALTAQHVALVAKVKQLLHLAHSQGETGQYDAALLTFEEVLRLDPYNKAAREGMIRVEKHRSDYFNAARDHTRAKMINDVNETWENKVPLRRVDVTSMFGNDGSTVPGSAVRGGRETILEKLRDIKVERIDFSGASLEEVVEYMRVRSRDLDPAKKGIDFVINIPRETVTPPISLALRDMPLEEVLRYVTQLAGLSYRVEDFAVRLVPLEADSSVIISKTYKVPPDFISRAAVGSSEDASQNPFGNSSSSGSNAPAGGLQFRRMDAKEYLASQGISFAEGAGASYSPVTGLLIVRNTSANIEMVDMLVEQAMNRSPKQVVVDVKMMEVIDNSLSEIGFDWLLGTFGRGNAVQGSGGTTGNQQDPGFAGREFPNQILTPGGGSTPVGQNPVTSGLRSSGDLAQQGIDSLIFNSSGGVDSGSRRAPGVLSLSGVLTDPQFQVVLRAVQQKKGIDMLSQPSVVARSGQQATIEITRELIYPTEFDPPQIPTNIGNNITVIDLETGAVIPQPLPPIPVTPTTPTSFDMRRTGTVLTVTPEISEDGRSVELTISPDFTEFAGFVNYGTPINQVDRFGSATELTPNLIYQPVFDTRRIVTSVKVWDGATVVLGGAITDREEIINDKVPVLGDMPFVGRLFKSRVKQRLTKNVLIFATVRVIDPAGSRINPDMR